MNSEPHYNHLKFYKISNLFKIVFPKLHYSDYSAGYTLRYEDPSPCFLIAVYDFGLVVFLAQTPGNLRTQIINNNVSVDKAPNIRVIKSGQMRYKSTEVSTIVIIIIDLDHL